MEKQYYNHINLLRGIAALMVCVFHFSTIETLHGELFNEDSWIRIIGSYGYLGVTVFFVLSGFVIPVSLQNSSFKLNRLHRFLARRYLRIEIPYIFSILLVIMVAFGFNYVNKIPFEFDITRFISHLLYTVSFTHHEWYNDIYWTLAIEIQFYILMALCFSVLNKNKYAATGILILLLAVAVFFTDPRFVTHFVPCFVAGITCWLYKQKKIKLWIFIVLLLLSIGTAGYIFKYYDSVVIISTVAFILFVPEMKERKFLIGKISYSLYLTNGVIGGNVIYFLVNRIYFPGSSLLIFVLAMITSIFFAYIFYRIIEKPSIRLSKKIEG